MSLTRLPFIHRQLAIWFLGFASGLPLALTGQAMQAWLARDGVDVATIGFLSLVGLPYTFKFLWAPLMDRFEPPWLGRRRGWLVLCQVLLALALAGMALTSPSPNTELFALIAVTVAFLSASQDVVIDAFRTDILPQEERGLGSSLSVFGYRLAMILSGGIAFIWADPNGYGWGWAQIYAIMSGVMVLAALISLTLVPALPAHLVAPRSEARRDVLGFMAVVLAVVLGYQLTQHVVAPLSDQVMRQVIDPTPTTLNLAARCVALPQAGVTAPSAKKKVDPPHKKWANLLTLLLGVGITLPLAWWASRRARFETLNHSLASYFQQPGAGAFLLFIVLYKLGDAFAGSLTVPFLIQGMCFQEAQIGVINKVFGLWLTIFGALLGGAIMIRLQLYWSLLIFGVLQLVSNGGFYLVALLGQGAWGSFGLPAFDWWIVASTRPTEIDWLLLATIGFENLSGGMGTAAFVAFLMALCNQRFSATQYALLSAFASVGRVWVGPLAGVLAGTIGWETFFVLSMVMAVPGLWMLWWLRQPVRALSGQKPPPDADD